MNEPFTPLLATRDWNEEWKALQQARQHADDPAIWDERSKTFATKHGSQSSYVDRFLELAAVEPGETVLDMGCGTGALACPLARQGTHVVAADFSQGMLGQLKAQLEQDGTSDLVDVKQMSWADDWPACGVADKSVDVAFASRSIATDDLGASLTKLTRVARRKACITLSVGPSPRVDTGLMRAAGLDVKLGHDFLYAFNILAGYGFAPAVSYISSERYESFDTPEDAVSSLGDILKSSARGIATEDELEAGLVRLEAWTRANLVDNERAGQEDSHGVVEKALRLAKPRTIVWAFISWDCA